MTTASRTRTTTSRSSGFWWAYLFILWMLALCPPPAHSTPAQATHSQCFEAISGAPNPIFLPCSFVTPSRYPEQWLTSGVEV